MLKPLPLNKSDGKRDACGSTLALFLAVLFLAVPVCARAESTDVQSPGAHATAAAHLDFKIVIPAVLVLNSSTGALFTNARAKDTIVIATTDTEIRRSIASRSDPRSMRAAIDALARETGSSPSSFTVATP